MVCNPYVLLCRWHVDPDDPQDAGPLQRSDQHVLPGIFFFFSRVACILCLTSVSLPSGFRNRYRGAAKTVQRRSGTAGLKIDAMCFFSPQVYFGLLRVTTPTESTKLRDILITWLGPAVKTMEKVRLCQCHPCTRTGLPTWTHTRIYTRTFCTRLSSCR